MSRASNIFCLEKGGMIPMPCRPVTHRWCSMVVFPTRLIVCRALGRVWPSTSKSSHIPFVL